MLFHSHPASIFFHLVSRYTASKSISLWLSFVFILPLCSFLFPLIWFSLHFFSLYRILTSDTFSFPFLFSVAFPDSFPPNIITWYRSERPGSTPRLFKAKWITVVHANKENNSVDNSFKNLTRNWGRLKNISIKMLYSNQRWREYYEKVRRIIKTLSQNCQKLPTGMFSRSIQS